MYAQRNGWPLKDVNVNVRYEPGPSGLSGSEGHRIVQSVTLIGELTSEQRSRLESIIDRCPTHKTLSAGVPIVAA
jgi:putative redox protein